MKRFLVIIVLVASSITSWSQNIPARPNPPKLVNDFANLLSPEQNQILEERLVAFDDSTSNQIAIVTVPDLGGSDIESYANKLFRSWGIGTAKHDNGILILVSKGDRQMRIEVGRGLEGPIPDVTAKDIIDNDLAPNFKEGNYYRGFDEAITSLEQAAAGEFHERRTRNNDNGRGGIIPFIIILIVVIFIVSRRGGGPRGGIMSRRGFSGWWIPFLFSGGWGNGRRGGGGWGGGGFGGGGFGGGGGGFGGLGGGSSGGGGASGGW